MTVDGDIVDAGGIRLTGGGVKGQASVFTRKAELETSKEQNLPDRCDDWICDDKNWRYEKIDVAKSAAGVPSNIVR